MTDPREQDELTTIARRTVGAIAVLAMMVGAGWSMGIQSASRAAPADGPAGPAATGLGEVRRVEGLRVLSSVAPTRGGTSLDDAPQDLPTTPSASLDPIPTSTPTSTPTPTPAPTGPPSYVAYDGTTHPAAPSVVRGRSRHELFFGEEFDSACYDGPGFRRGMDALTDVARMIRASGRQVVFSVAPDKSAVMPGSLKGVNLPHGACARRGLNAQKATLDGYPRRFYLPVRSTLAHAHRRTYWAGDTHWNSIGAADFADALAQRLDPRVAGLLCYRRIKDTLEQYLLVLLGRSPRRAERTAPGIGPTGGTRVRTARGSTPISSEKVTTFDHSWRSSPTRRTVRGRTVLIGDSFSYLALRALRPVFANGRFLWIGEVADDVLVSAILDADTVVLEQVQRYVARSVLIQPAFVDRLRTALSSEQGPGRR